MKLYEAVAQTLMDAGVGRIFGVMGNGNEEFLASYLDAKHGAYVAATHEGGAVSMADGYARRSGQVGVATVTHGPGVTNALTSLGEAVRARTAVVLITGDTAPQREHRQWLDLRAAAHLVGASYREVHKPETAVDDVVLALRLSQSLRRPVVLNIPVSLMNREVEYIRSAFGVVRPPDQAIGPDADQLDAALGVIASADRPMILVGRGSVLAHARDAVLSLAKRLNAPTATTVLALDYLAGHEMDLGIFGNESHSLAVEYIVGADCVIVLGAGLNEHTTAKGDLLRGKAVVQCDNDLLLLNSRYPVTVPVLADARVFAERVDEAIAELGPRRISNWTAALPQRLREFDRATDFIDESDDTTIDMRTALATLDRILPPDRILITDNGRFKTAPWRHMHCSPGEFAHTGAFGSIGLALAHSIGSSFARPDQLIVVATGDGGVMQGLLELVTAVEHRLPLLVAVLNDGAFGAEYKTLKQHGHDPEYSLRSWPDLAEVAISLGARGAVVTSVADIESLEATLHDLDGPMLLDIRANPAIDPRRYK